ncbi:hypothetical protein FNF28_06007 [Cafeteria roenbergensis]|uniref:Sde2 N-terminal ubiquitin domain-containing protein n=1 Tax=Cafeteria roenbergensis TaxID=33653 RepID=A0A5A8D0T4_CAFRO|nr:hypothetical protein FNF28_06007 [Cafeteria roenbergensis]
MQTLTTARDAPVLVDGRSVGLRSFAAELPTTAARILRRAAAALRVPASALRLSSACGDAGGCRLGGLAGASADSPVLPGTIARLQWAGLLGGKGGFGATLKSASKGGNGVTNFGFCRDLNGRRLRHINAERRLRAWASPEEVERRERLGAAYHEPRGESRIIGWHMGVPAWARLQKGQLKAAQRAERREEWRREAELGAAADERDERKAAREREARRYLAAGKDAAASAASGVADALRTGLDAEETSWGVGASAVYARGAAAAAAAAGDGADAGDGDEGDEDDWMVDVEADAASAAAAAAASAHDDPDDDSGVDASPWLELAPVRAGPAGAAAPGAAAPAGGPVAEASHSAAGSGHWAALADAEAAPDTPLATMWAPSAAWVAGAGSGDWKAQFEVVVLTGGVGQVGWAALPGGGGEGFACSPALGEGVGDDAAGRSVAWDGARGLMWRGGESTAAGSAKWRAGDVVGCCCSHEAGVLTISWLLNGEAAAETAVAADAGWSGICPAVSMEGGQQLQVNLGASDVLPLAFPVGGCEPAGARLADPRAAAKRPRSDDVEDRDSQEGCAGESSAPSSKRMAPQA